MKTQGLQTKWHRCTTRGGSNQVVKIANSNLHLNTLNPCHFFYLVYNLHQYTIVSITLSSTKNGPNKTINCAKVQNKILLPNYTKFAWAPPLLPLPIWQISNYKTKNPPWFKIRKSTFLWLLPPARHFFWENPRLWPLGLTCPELSSFLLSSAIVNGSPSISLTSSPTCRRKSAQTSFLTP